MRAAIQSAAASALLALAVGTSPLQAADTLNLASGRSNGAAYAAGVGLSSLIKFKLLPSERIDLQAMESAGVVDNVRRLQAGDAQLAILPSVVGHSARLGIGPFAGDAPETKFRAIAALWRDALHLVVRADDVSTGTIDDLSRLKDRRVFLGDASSGMIDANRLLLSDLGMEADQTFQLATLGDGDAMSAIRRGDIDAFSTATRPPEAAFEGLFDDPSSGLRLLDVTETQMTRVNGNHWLWTPYVIEADTYPGQRDDIWTIALSNLLVVRADVDADVVYEVTKSIFENIPYLERVDPIMADLSLDGALDGVTMPLHPGALRYFNEVGLIPTSEAGTLPAPAVTPVGRDRNEPVTPQQRYPDSDVAGDLPAGTGGPLLKTTPPELDAKPEPFWKRRATL